MPKDTIKIKDESNFSINTPNRETLVAIQTPQVFNFNEILECHKKVKLDKLIVTDLSLIHISEPTRPSESAYAVFCLKKKPVS